MSDSPRYNFPDKTDSNFADKVVDLVRTLFEKGDSPIKNLSPITSPEGTRQIGDMWFDSSDEKIKVNTSTGIKTVKYE